MSNSANNKIWWIGLGVILIAAFLLRFWGFNQQGLFYYDEAWYRLVAQTLMQLPEWGQLINNGSTAKEAFADVFHWGFYPHLSFKPTYIVCLMLCNAIFGLFNPMSGAVVSLLAGLGIVAVGGIITRKVTGNVWWGLLAAALLAFSGLEVLYSRFTLPHQLGALGLMFYSWLYCYRLNQPAPSKRYLYLVGVALGLLLTLHDLFLPIVMVLLAFEALVLLWNHWPELLEFKIIKPLNRFFVFVAGFMTPLLFWEVVIVLLRKLFHRTLGKGYVLPYHQEIFNHVTVHDVSVEKVATQADYGYFFKAFLETEGVGFIILMLLGFVGLGWLCLKNREKTAQYLYMLGLSVISLALITVYPSKIIRLCVPFLPLLYLVAVFGGRFVFDGLKGFSKPLAVVVTSFVVISALFPALSFNLSTLPLMKSGFGEAAAYIGQNLKPGERMATALNYPQYIFYLQKPVSIVRQPSDIARQEAKYGEKIAYLTFEFGNIIPICEAQTELCERMNRHRELGKKEAFYSDQLVYTADSPITQSLSTLLNTHGVYADHQTLSQYVTETSLDKIRVYQLKK